MIVFDWGGTAVLDRRSDARALGAAMDSLLRAGARLAVVTGTRFSHVDAGLAGMEAVPGDARAARRKRELRSPEHLYASGALARPLAEGRLPEERALLRGARPCVHPARRAHVVCREAHERARSDRLRPGGCARHGQRESARAHVGSGRPAFCPVHDRGHERPLGGGRRRGLGHAAADGPAAGAGAGPADGPEIHAGAGRFEGAGEVVEHRAHATGRVRALPGPTSAACRHAGRPPCLRGVSTARTTGHP